MGKTKTTQAPSRDHKAAARAASLPTDRAELLAVAKAATSAFNVAVMACDDAGAAEAVELVEAVVWQLNGGTFFGCSADEDSAGNVVARHCGAEPGTVPAWGQQGEFLIEVAGIRALVKCSDGFGWMRCHLEFHAVDVHGPFISETGYRSHFGSVVGGVAVDEAARRVMAALLKENGRCMVRPESRPFCEERAARPWLASSADAPAATFEDDGGQVCFAF